MPSTRYARGGGGDLLVVFVCSITKPCGFSFQIVPNDVLHTRHVGRQYIVERLLRALHRERAVFHRAQRLRPTVLALHENVSDSKREQIESQDRMAARSVYLGQIQSVQNLVVAFGRFESVENIRRRFLQTRHHGP